MATVLVYLITVQTSQARKKRLPNDSLHFLKDHLESCNKLRKGIADAGCRTFDSILIAPEYLFSEYKHGHIWHWLCHDAEGRQRIPISKKDTQSLLTKLMEISKDYPKTVIIPGTVFHSEVVASATDKLKIGQNNVIREFRAKKVRGTDLDSLNYKDPRERSTSAKGELNELGQKMKTGSVKTARNTCFILHGGRLVHRYDKETGFDENYDDPRGKGYFVSVNTADCFTVDNLRFGVEICFDHNQKCLKSKNHADISFHIVVSDTVEAINAHMAMQDGGYFMHASSYEPDTQIVKNHLGKMKPLGPPNFPSFQQLKNHEGYKAYTLDDIPDVAVDKPSYAKGKIPLPGLKK